MPRLSQQPGTELLTPSSLQKQFFDVVMIIDAFCLNDAAENAALPAVLPLFLAY